MMDFDVSNTRLEKQMQRKDYEKEYLTRNKIYGDVMVTETDATNKSNIIFKLKKILSKKYNLSDQEYIIIIDKFKLNSANLNKTTLVHLLSYLNEQNKYKQLDDTYVDEPVKSKNTSTMNGSINNIMDALVSNNKEFIMEGDDIPKIDIIPLKTQETKKKSKKKKKKKKNPTKPPALEEDFQDRMNNYIEKTKIDDIIKPLPAPVKVKPKQVPSEIISHHQIMINILNNGRRGNQFIVPIKNTFLYKNLQNISIAKIHICNNILNKYNLHTGPHFFIQIEELLNNFHINDSQKNYFAMIKPIKENTETVCNVIYTTKYTPASIFTLETLSITIFNSDEKPVTIIDYDENKDFIHIIFDVFCL